MDNKSPRGKRNPRGKFIKPKQISLVSLGSEERQNAYWKDGWAPARNRESLIGQAQSFQQNAHSHRKAKSLLKKDDNGLSFFVPFNNDFGFEP